MQLGIPTPPKQIFENDFSPESLVTHQAQSMFMIEKFEYPEEGGIYVYKFGGQIINENGEQKIINAVRCLYPDKGFPSPEAISACNFAKRALISQLRFLTQKSFLICLSPLLFLPFRSKIRLAERFINEYNGLSETILTPIYLKDRYLCNLAKELQKLISIFLTKMGIREQYSQAFGKNIATLIEYDTAYKYRIEDILSETTSQRLKIAPRREIRRLLTIFATRDLNITTQAKFNTIGKLLSLILLVPRIKKAFQQSLEEIDFTRLQLDEADRYHILKFDRYNFLGRTLEDRYNEYVKLHDGFPPMMQVISSQPDAIG